MSKNHEYSLVDGTDDPPLSSSSSSSSSYVDTNETISTLESPALTTASVLQPFEVEPSHDHHHRSHNGALTVGDHDDDDNNNNNDHNDTDMDDMDDDDQDGGSVALVQSTTAAAEVSSAITSSSLSSWLHDWLYPPNVPRSCQLLRLENVAVPCCYLLVGLSKGLSGPLLNVYPLDLNATEAQQTTFTSALALPASMKILFGFLSDNVPIYGFRRKSYMILGCLLTSASFWGLLLFTNLQPIPSESSSTTTTNSTTNTINNNTTILSSHHYNHKSLLSTFSNQNNNIPSIPFLGLSFLFFSTGFWIADVMAESIVAEKSKLEPPHVRGTLQSSCYAYRFFGKMIAVPCATWLYSQVGPGSIFLLLSALPLAVLPLIWFLHETPVVIAKGGLQPLLTTTSSSTTIKPTHNQQQQPPVVVVVPSTREQCQEIWHAVCSRAVWQPMAFVYLFNLLQVNNSAWKQFLKSTLGFTADNLNIILIVTYVLMYFGILAYKYGMIRWSWRSVYILTTLLSGVLSLLQVLLIHGQTFGLSKFLFCLGDDAFAEFLHGIQFMPTTIMMVHLCPNGSEGASFAMFTTASNCAQALSRTISTHLLTIWNVSKDALVHHQLQGLTNLTYLTTALHVSGILFVGWLPNTKEDLIALNQTTQSSWIGGTIFLSVTFLSVVYAIVIGVLNMVAPGWMGES